MTVLHDLHITAGGLWSNGEDWPVEEVLSTPVNPTLLNEQLLKMLADFSAAGFEYTLLFDPRSSGNRYEIRVISALGMPEPPSAQWVLESLANAGVVFPALSI